ncbi:MAG: GTP-binding protein, partial [Oscillospiraceae bacterium]|nr:GTP-binding protein [Oscillospiraceae bacterium]
MKRLVICMTAHVDAGKTTLTEALLYRAGEIRRLGRVDNGDAFLDTDPQERSRGITIFSKQAIMRTDAAEMTLLDTPGHVDFSAEAERALTVPDCAVLVISGTDGVQSHTHTLWELLSRFKIPTFVFVNKMDISHRSRAELLSDLHKLDKRFADFSDDPAEQCAELDEDCMNALLERSEVPDQLIAAAVSARNVFPVCFGAALRSEGVDKLTELLERFAEPRERYGEFAALVYKITSDENGARLTHMKINGGELKNRAVIEQTGEKVTQIRLYSGAKFTAVDRAEAGQLVAVTGLSETFAGQALGAQKTAAAPVIEPVLSYRAELPPGTDVPTTLAKLKKLEEEDPQLRFSWSEQLGEIHV